MAKVLLSRADARRALGLQTVEDVEVEIRAGRLPIAAYTRQGWPLFDAEDVRRALMRTLHGQESRPA